MLQNGDTFKQIKKESEMSFISPDKDLLKVESHTNQTEQLLISNLENDPNNQSCFNDILNFYLSSQKLPEEEFLLKYKSLYVKNSKNLLSLGQIYFNAGQTLPQCFKPAYDFLTALTKLKKEELLQSQLTSANLLLANIQYFHKKLILSLAILKQWNPSRNYEEIKNNTDKNVMFSETKSSEKKVTKHLRPLTLQGYIKFVFYQLNLYSKKRTSKKISMVLGSEETLHSPMLSPPSIPFSLQELQELFNALYLQARIDIYYQQQGAIKKLIRCIHIDPSNPLPYFTMAYYLFLQQSKNSWKFYESGQEKLSPQNQTPEIALILSALRAAQDFKIKESVQILQASVKQYPKSEMSYYYMGELFIQTKEYKLAVESYTKCLENISEDLDSLSSMLISKEQNIKCRCNLATALFLVRRTVEAFFVIEECLVTDANNIEAQLIKLRILMQKDDHLKAFELAKRLTLADPNSSMFLYLLGLTQLKMKKPFSSIISFMKCKKINPEFPNVCLKIAAVYETISRPQLALEFLMKHLIYCPNSKLALLRSSKLLAYFGKPKLARVHLDKLFELLASPVLQKNRSVDRLFESILSPDEDNVELAEALQVEGYLFEKESNYLAAIGSFQKAFQLNPIEEILFLMAEIFSKLENTKEEIKKYEILLKISDSSGSKVKSYLVNLGNAFRKDNQLQNAIDTFNKAIQTAKQEGEEESPDILANLSECFIVKNDFDQAIKLLLRGISHDRFHTESYFLLGIAYKSKGDSMNALKQFEKSIKTDLNFAVGFLNLAILKRELGMLGEAISVCQQGLQHSPRSLYLQQYLGDCLLQAKDPFQALALFENIVNQITKDIINQGDITVVEPKHTKILVSCNIQISRVYCLLQEHTNAINHLKKQLKVSPNQPDYLHELGRLILLNGDKSAIFEALGYIAKLVSLCPNNPIYFMTLAETYHQARQFQEEIQTLMQCMKLKPIFMNQIFNNLAVAYSETNQTQKALDVYQRSLQINADQEVVYFNIGNLYLQKLNDIKEARESFEKCLRINSTHLGALNNLAGIFIKTKQFDLAIDCIRECLKLAPQKKGQFFPMLKLLLKKGN